MADEQPDWLQGVLDDAATKREENPAMVPPSVSTEDNSFFNITEEEKEARFKWWNYLIISIIVIQLIALGFVIWWP